MVSLEDYLIKEDADLVGLAETVRGFLKKRFPKTKFTETLESSKGLGDKDPIATPDNPEYKPLLQVIQGMRQRCHKYPLKEDLVLYFDVKDKDNGIFFNLHDYNIVMNDEGWTDKQKEDLIDAIKGYIETS
jgi:hypothetical protein